MNPLRSLILAAASNDVVRKVVASAPGSRSIVDRFVAGEDTDAAVAAVRAVVDKGLTATLDYLGEDTTDAELAERTVQAYLQLLDRLHDDGLADRAEVSVKLTALGLGVEEKMAADNAFRIAAAAEQCGTTVTVDMEDHTVTDATLEIAADLRKLWPSVGVVVQSYLRRTEADVAALATEGSRVRIVKGAYAEPSDVAYTSGSDIDDGFLRCADILIAAKAYPMFATHDPKLIAAIAARLADAGCGQDSYEYQMLYGVRPDEQLRLAEAGERVRVYIPYGEQWYGYLMRRLAERPANTAFFLRALASKS